MATNSSDPEAQRGEDVAGLDAEFSLSAQPSATLANFLADWRAIDPTSGQACWQRNRVARQHLNHLLHTRMFQILIIVLVLIDAVIVVAELAIDLGLLNSDGRQGLESSPWPRLLHAVSLSILTFFLLEAGAKLYAMGLSILHHKMELLDMFIIVVSFGLDVASAVPGSQLTALFGLVVLLRLWRVVRIVNSIALSVRLQGQKSLARQVELRAAAEQRCEELLKRLGELNAGLGEALALLTVDCGPTPPAVSPATLKRLKMLLELSAPEQQQQQQQSTKGSSIVEEDAAVNSGDA